MSPTPRHSYDCPICEDTGWVFKDVPGKKWDACFRCTRKSEVDWRTQQRLQGKEAA